MRESDKNIATPVECSCKYITFYGCVAQRKSNGLLNRRLRCQDPPHPPIYAGVVQHGYESRNCFFESRVPQDIFCEHQVIRDYEV